MPAGTCPYCSQRFNLAAERGEQVQCPSCGHPLRVVVQPPPPPPPPVSRQCKEGEGDFDFGELQSPQNQYSAKRFPSRKVVLVASLAVTVAVIVVAAKLAWPTASKGLTTVRDNLTVDHDMAAVRAYLRENLNDPHWEEVKWWPARIGNNYYKNERVCRLKYRAKTGPFLRLHDQTFIIAADGVRPSEQYENVQQAIWHMEFETTPEGQPLPFDSAIRELGGFEKSGSEN